MLSKNFTAFSDTVHVPTALSRNRLSFSESNVHALTTWTGTLTLLKLGDTSEAILRALCELSELKCNETLRYDLIQALHPVVEHILNTLEKLFIQQGPQHRDRQSHLIELSTRIRLYLIHIYLDIVYRSQQQLQQRKRLFFGLGFNRNLKTARVLSSYYALQQFALLLVQQQKRYSHCLKQQWYSIHQLYHLAQHNQEHLTNINLLQGSHYPLKHIQHAYVQILLLDIFNTYQIRPEEIEALLYCSSEWVKRVEISNKVSHLTRYMVDTQQDLPPCYYYKTQDHPDTQQVPAYQNPPLEADLFISTQNLLEHINSTIQHEAKYMSELERKYLSSALQFHIQNVLGTSHAQRRHQRYESSLQLALCFSVQVAHFHLANSSLDQALADVNLVDAPVDLAIRSGLEQHQDLAPSSVPDSDKAQSPPIQTVAVAVNIDDTAPSQIAATQIPVVDTTVVNAPIVETVASSAQPKYAFELDREALQFHNAQVLDVSAYGYRIHWTMLPQPKLLNTGEFILLRESPTQAWKAGVVRWMKKSVTQTYAMGLEVLAEQVLPCRLEIRTQHSTAQQGLFFPSLILQHIRPEQAAISLVLPNSPEFDEYTNWVLHFSTDQIELVFKKILLITESFVQVEFMTQSSEQQHKLSDIFKSKAIIPKEQAKSRLNVSSAACFDHAQD